MRHRTNPRLIGFALGLGLLAGALAARAEEAAHSSTEAPRIDAAETKRLVDAGQAVIIDVRAPQDYEVEHIAGALSVPGWELAQRHGELPKEKLIVAYCT